MTSSPQRNMPTQGGNSRFYFAALLVGMVLLLPLLAFPLGQDQSAYIRGAQAILRGGFIYVDFIDVKPPGIFYLTAIPVKLFGAGAFPLRALDYLWQSATIALLISIIMRYQKSKFSAMISAVLYSVFYVSLNNSQTYQTEGQFALFALIAMHFSDKISLKNAVITSFCFGAVFILKFTLAAIAIPFVLLWHHSTKNTSKTIQYTSLVAALSIVWAGILTLPHILSEDVRASYPLIVSFIKTYNSNPPINLHFVSESVKAVGLFLGGWIGPAVMVAAAVSLGYVFNTKRGTSNDDKSLRLIVFGFTASAIMLITVLIERKLTPYQFSRLNFPVILFSATGFVYLLSSWWNWFTSGTAKTRLMLLAVAAICIALSPASRYVNVVYISTASLTQPDLWAKYLTRPDEVGMNQSSVLALKEHLNATIPAGQRVFVMSMMATSSVPEIHSAAPSVFADPHFYTATSAPSEWKRALIEELKGVTWLAIDTVDICRGVTAHDKSTWQSIRTDPDLLAPINANFYVSDTVATYIIMHRK